MAICYIGIGSNLGDRQAYINKAIEKLRVGKDIKVIRVSTIYETDPVSEIPQCKFLNGVIKINTGLKPKALLKKINKIEKALGRERTMKNAPRTIDLDILYYADEKIKEKGLEIPHPRIQQREFVLRGLRELGKV